jgi:hypothetical protein
MRVGRITFRQPCYVANDFYNTRPKRRNQPEGKVVLEILHNLAHLNWFCGKVKVKGIILPNNRGFAFDRYAMRGLPDIFAFKDGVMLGIECKAGKNTTTEQQEEFKNHFHSPPNRIYVVARNWQDVASKIQS